MNYLEELKQRFPEEFHLLVEVVYQKTDQRTTYELLDLLDSAITSFFKSLRPEDVA